MNPWRVDFQVEVENSSATQSVLTILAIITALQTIAVLIVVGSVAYIYRKRMKLSGAATGSVEEHSYEKMNPVNQKKKAPELPARGTRKDKAPTLSRKSISYTKK